MVETDCVYRILFANSLVLIVKACSEDIAKEKADSLAVLFSTSVKEISQNN